MKTIIKTLLLCIGMGVLVACGNSDNINDPTPVSATPVLSSKGISGVSARFAAQTSTFAFDYLQQINQKQPNKNVLVSPLSLNMALGMLLNGAEKTTATEIQQALRIEGISLDELNKTCQNLMTNLGTLDNNVKLGIANSTWQRNSLSIEKTFTDNLSNYFKAETNTFDINKKEEAKSAINQWVSSKTNGKIPSIIDQVPNNAAMFLLNAVYFQGNWKYKFDVAKTYNTTFTTSTKQPKTVKMMSQRLKVRMAEGTNYAAYELPYSNGAFRMTIVIPDNGVNIDTFVQSFGYAAWQTLNSKLIEQEHEIGLPKFELNFETELKDVLDAMGMKKAFTNLAELTKISKTNGLFVSGVKQKTYLNIDEAGTEAAAATSISVGITAVPTRNYIADRPFMLVISEKGSDTVLFAGKVANP
jgi:serine protease inhibitor